MKCLGVISLRTGNDHCFCVTAREAPLRCGTRAWALLEKTCARGHWAQAPGVGLRRASPLLLERKES